MTLLSQAAAGIQARLQALADRPDSLTLADVIDRYMAAYTGRDSSLCARLQAWRELLGTSRLCDIDADVMHAARAEIAAMPALAYKGRDADGRPIFKAKPGKTRTPATINRYMAAVSAVFTWAIEERLAPRRWSNPCRGVRRVRGEVERVRFLDEGERAALLASCAVSRYPRLHAMVLMALLTGARRGELLALRWRDVDLDAGRAQLATTKNGDRRVLVLLPQVVEALRPFASTDGTRYVFGSPKSRFQSPASIDTAWREAVKRAGVKDFRFHDLRHCCASYLAQAGTPLNVIAEVLGHRKLDMTKRYSHLTVDTKALAMSMALGRIGTA